MSQDRALQESVLSKLVWELGVNAAHIDVIADNGIAAIKNTLVVA